MITKQPELVLQAPIRVQVDPNGPGVYFTSVLNQTFRWKSQKAPSGVVMWYSEPAVAVVYPEVTAANLPETLYATIKTFYIGNEPKPVYRSTDNFTDRDAETFFEK